MTDKKKDQKLQKILVDLQSGETKKVAQAIKSLEVNGNVTVIRPVLDLVKSGSLSEKNQEKAIELLCSLKDTSVTAEIMDVLEEDEYNSIKQTILSIIWNTKVDFSDYIDEFVEIATKGDFMEALECLTIIENLEGPFLEETILESQLHLKNYLENEEIKKDEQKAHILSEIALKIKEINISLMD